MMLDIPRYRIYPLKNEMSGSGRSQPMSKAHIRFGTHIATAALALLALAPRVHAGETKGFVVSWFNVAEYADPQNRDCPHGVNDGPEIYYRRELKQSGLPQAQIDKYINEFLDLSKFATTIPVA